MKLSDCCEKSAAAISNSCSSKRDLQGGQKLRHFINAITLSTVNQLRCSDLNNVYGAELNARRDDKSMSDCQLE